MCLTVSSFVQVPAKRRGKVAAAEAAGGGSCGGQKLEATAEQAAHEEAAPKAGRVKAHASNEGLHPAVLCCAVA